MPTHFAVTLAYVHTDSDSLPSFAEECSFGTDHRIHTTDKPDASRTQSGMYSRWGTGMKSFSLLFFEFSTKVW